MGREFSLELGLWPSSQPTFQLSAIPMWRMVMPFTNLNHHHQQQQIMVFCNATPSLSDFTELQARAILWLASRERNNSTTRWSDSEWLSLRLREDRNGNAGFSIKKSLQRFLQRRKARRSRSMSPYKKIVMTK